MTPFFKDDETGGDRLAAEELARELLQGVTISSGDIVRLSLALPFRGALNGPQLSRPFS